MTRLEQREGDLPERSPGAGPVDRGRLVDIHGYRLQSSQVEEHHRARRRPGVQADDRRQRRALLREPGVRMVVAEVVQHRVEEAVGRKDVGRNRGDCGRRSERREVERGPEKRAETDRLVDDHREREPERHLQGNDTHRVDERVTDRVVPEDAVVIERPVVAPADERPFEDLPVVAADVEGVADRNDEEEQEERHRHTDEPVAHECLARSFGSQPTNLPSFRPCASHAPPSAEQLPRASGRHAREHCPVDQSYFAAAAIFASMALTDSLPSMTAVSSLFATSFQT